MLPVSELGGAIPIEKLSAFNAPGRRSIAIVLKTYLDGSGKFEDPKSRFLTLAAVFADDTEWRGIESSWNGVLESPHGAKYSHMRELVRGDGPFVGWSDTRKEDFVNKLFASLYDQASLRAASLTIDLSEYRQIRYANKKVKPAAAVCVDFCMTHAFGHEEFYKGNAEVFFDRNEGFIRFLERVWNRYKKGASGWPPYVATVAPADMKATPAIQVADLIAWSANRCHEQRQNDKVWRSNHFRSCMGIKHSHSLFKRSELIQHPGFYDWR